METPKIKAVKATPVNKEIPEVKVTPNVIETETMMTIFIDPEMVGKQGIRINGKVYVGHITVPKVQADDLLRIQEEYWETVKKMKDPAVVVRMKNDFQKETLFLADPNENQGKKGFSRDYGFLPQREFLLCSKVFQEHLLNYRKQLYGY